MAVLKVASGVIHEFGGEPHSGWLPPGAAAPSPTPVRRVTLDVSIESIEAACLLIVEIREGDGFSSDTWFDTLAMAEQAALEQFGIGPEQWGTPPGR